MTRDTKTYAHWYSQRMAVKAHFQKLAWSNRREAECLLIELQRIAQDAAQAERIRRERS